MRLEASRAIAGSAGAIDGAGRPEVERAQQYLGTILVASLVTSALGCKRIDLDTLHFACRTNADCVHGTLCNPGCGICLAPPETCDAGTAGMPDGGAPRAMDCRPPDAEPGGSPLSGRIFAAKSCPGQGLTDGMHRGDCADAVMAPIYDVSLGTLPAQPFATVETNGYLYPLVITTDGRFFAASNARGGTIWEISRGGVFTSSSTIATQRPLAARIFGRLDNELPGDTPYLIEGMAIDPRERKLYASHSELLAGSVAVISLDSRVEYLARKYDNPTGLLVCGDVLLIAEAGAGMVVAHDLIDHGERVLAMGFKPGFSNIAASLVADRRGRVMTFWTTLEGQTGVFDITDGGDFARSSALIPLPDGLDFRPFHIDVNQLAVDRGNNLYMAGAWEGIVFTSAFVGGRYSVFQRFMRGPGLLDTDSLAIGP